MRARQEPTFSSGLPSLACTDGEAAAQLAAAFFGDPLEWQRFILDVLLARDERDLRTFPRQLSKPPSS